MITRNTSILTLLLVVALHAPPCRAAEANRLSEIVVVFKTHFDIGYTDMATNIVQRYRTTMIDQALDVVDQNRNLPPEQQFVWTLAGWPMYKILQDWPGQSPQRKARVEQALKMGGSWCMACRLPRIPSCSKPKTWCAAWGILRA